MKYRIVEERTSSSKEISYLIQSRQRWCPLWTRKAWGPTGRFRDVRLISLWGDEMSTSTDTLTKAQRLLSKLIAQDNKVAELRKASYRKVVYKT